MKKEETNYLDIKMKKKKKHSDPDDEICDMTKAEKLENFSV